MAGARDEFSCSHKHRANRCYKSFAQTKHNGIGRTDQILDQYVLSDRRVEDARTINVKSKLILMCQLLYLPDVGERQRHTTADVLGGLETDKTSDWVMHIFRANRSKDVMQGERSIRLILDRTRLNPAQRGHATCFI